MSQFCLLAASLLSQGQIPGWQLAAPPPHPSTTTTKQPCPTPLAKGSQPRTEQPLALSPPQFSPRSPHPSPLTSRSMSDRAFPIAAQPELPGLDTTGQAYLPFSSVTRPATGSQLYQQRLAALRDGRLYTRISTNSYPDAWRNATAQPTHEQWVRLLAVEARAIARGQGSNRLTVMVGDSLYLWYPPEQLSGTQFWLNQGISGDTTEGVLSRLSAFAQTRPTRIQVMVGINDLRHGATDDRVLGNLRQIMRQLRQTHPQSAIVVESILPTRLPTISADRIHRINDRLAQITQQEGVNFADLQQQFSDNSGRLRPDLTTDGLHLNSQGYATWRSAL